MSEQRNLLGIIMSGHHIYNTARFSPRILDSTGRIVGRQVVGQDNSKQLKPNRVVFIIGISATKSIIYQTIREKM